MGFKYSKEIIKAPFAREKEESLETYIYSLIGYFSYIEVNFSKVIHLYIFLIEEHSSMGVHSYVDIVSPENKPIPLSLADESFLTLNKKDVFFYLERIVNILFTKDLTEKHYEKMPTIILEAIYYFTSSADETAIVNLRKMVGLTQENISTGEKKSFYAENIGRLIGEFFSHCSIDYIEKNRANLQLLLEETYNLWVKIVDYYRGNNNLLRLNTVSSMLDFFKNRLVCSVSKRDNFFESFFLKLDKFQQEVITAKNVLAQNQDKTVDGPTNKSERRNSIEFFSPPIEHPLNSASQTSQHLSCEGKKTEELGEQKLKC